MSAKPGSTRSRRWGGAIQLGGDTKRVKEFVERIKEARKGGAVGSARGLRQPAIIKNGRVHHRGYSMFNHPRGYLGKLLKRAMKKAAQPHRTNHKRKAMRRRAAGKNEVRP